VLVPTPGPAATSAAEKGAASPAPQPPAPAPPQPPPEAPAWAFEHWLQDFDRAQRQARDEGKDVLLLFDGSDWSDYSQDLAREVFARPESWQRLTAHFVPVHIDFPQHRRARLRVQNAGRNEALQARFFQRPGYPRVVLTDAAGRPYVCEEGYPRGSAEQYLERLESAGAKREGRDELLAAVGSAAGEAKLSAASEALDFLAREIEDPSARRDGTYILSLVEFYGPLLKEWRALADVHDPKNAAGYQERFFRADWGRRGRRVMADLDADRAALRALAEEFESWRRPRPFKDPDVAADLLTVQARLRTRLGDPRAAEQEVRAALALKPSPDVRKVLTQLLPKEAQGGVGTGFAVAPGHVLTNDHVVGGRGAVRVRIGARQFVDGTVVARDEDTDLALLKVELPPGVTLPLLRITPEAPAGRGTEVMALGYALGPGALKFTRGSVSAPLGDPDGELPLLLLDQRLNPGNSGGPLCDTCGNLVGVVAAKTLATARVDSYGIAVGARAVDRFLRRHLKEEDYWPSHPQRQPLDWAAVDRRVSPSVVLVVKEPD
jgi:S1-C subfamily serine protease